MSQLTKRRFDEPDKTMEVDHAKVEIVEIGGLPVRRMTCQPGWHWKTSMGPVLGTESCPVQHLFFTISGCLTVRMDDGTTVDIEPGEIGVIPDGHDAWVTGDEPLVGIDFQGKDVYDRLLG